MFDFTFVSERERERDDEMQSVALSTRVKYLHEDGPGPLLARHVCHS